MGRKILGLIAGILVAFVSLWLIDAIGHIFYPIPADLDQNDMAAWAEFVKAMPLGALLFVLAGWFIATLVGGWLACFIVKVKPMLFAGIVGGLMLIVNIISLVMIPHPLWFSITAVIGILLATYLAAKAGTPKSAQQI